MIDVLLINPPIYYNKDEDPISLDSSFPPLGLLYLSSILIKNHIKTKFIDIAIEKQTISETIKYIKKYKPKIIGISAMTPTLQGALSISKAIKKKFPPIKICLGGPHISADPNFINRHKFFDFAVVGESENTFLELIIKILNNKKVSGIYQGLPEKNLDNLPWPARQLVNLNKYQKRASLIATRGCPFNCYYCSRPAISNCVKCRSPQDILDEMNWLYPHCQGEYLFQDDSLTINKKHILALSSKIIKNNKKFHWSGYTRVDLVDEEIISNISQAGCTNLTFGIESGDEKLRNEIIKKRFSND